MKPIDTFGPNPQPHGTAVSMKSDAITPNPKRHAASWQQKAEVLRKYDG